jgi:hypothetical protein
MRGIKDETFVRRAFNFLDYTREKRLVNQSSFNYEDSKGIDIELHSSLIAAVFMYVKLEKLPEESIEEIYNINNLGQARDFIDKYADMTYSGDKE